MTLKFGEIVTMYQDETDDTLTDVRVLAQWIYLAENKIAQAYGPVKEITITAEKKTRYALPADLIKMSEVELDGSEYYDFQVSAAGEISFDDAGDYTIRYHYMPVMIDYKNLDSVPACHGLFHAAIPHFLVGKYWTTTSEGIAGEVRMAQAYFQSFYEMVQEAKGTLERRERRPTIARVRRF